MSDNKNNNDLLIVNAINNQTEIFKDTMKMIGDKIIELDKMTKENNKMIKEIHCDRCINSSFEYGNFTIRMKTIMSVILILQICEILTYNNIDSNFIKSILLQLL